MEQFVNILTKSEYSSDVLWVSRYVRFTKAFIAMDRKASSHDELKEDVLNSDVMKAIEELELEANTAGLAHLHAGVHKILAEIGYTKSLATIRWLALLTMKIIHKTLDGIYVNEASLKKLKASMGDTPYIIVPTHRSYSDFILMAFICFVYEIEIPCVAAGIDVDCNRYYLEHFHKMELELCTKEVLNDSQRRLSYIKQINEAACIHKICYEMNLEHPNVRHFLSMWAMGEILRKTKAFFMRRTFQDDKLYKVIFRQYISSMVSQGDSPIEFFIEGTRSRTGKSLKPKYGLLSMILKPFLEGEVPDIKLVPVSISYDRFLEEWLFARELLGTPKPKESTKGLFKVFSILNQNYGNVYFNFGDPISLHDWISREVDCPLPRPVSQDVKKIASLVMQFHSKLQVLGVFHLVMVIMYDNLVTHNLCEMPLSLVTNRLKLLLSAMQALGTNVLLTKGELIEEIHYACSINPELIIVSGGRLRFLGKHQEAVQSLSRSQAFGDIKTGTNFDPNKVVLLVLYVNPVAMVLFSPSLLLALISTNKVRSDVLDGFNFLCELYENEFPVICCNKENSFEESKTFLLATGCMFVCPDDENYYVSSNCQLIHILNSIAHPYLLGYLLISQYMIKVTGVIAQKKLLIECRNHLQMKSQSEPLFPVYSSKSFVTYCLSALTKMGCLYKDTRTDEDTYSVNNQRISYTISLLKTLVVHSKNELDLKNKL